MLVAGAGPAGSAAALLLARDGARVTIVERAQFPRVKPCGEYLSAATVRLLREFGVSSSLQKHAAVLRGVRVYSGGAQASFLFTQAGWSLPRATLDNVLLQEALKAGAQLIHGRVEHVTCEPDGAVAHIRLPSGEMHEQTADLAIAADGAHSLIAKQLQLHAPPGAQRRFALGGHYSNVGGLDDTVRMFVDGPSYFAVNPLGERRANVMLIVNERDLQAHRHRLDDYVRERSASLTGGSLQFDQAQLDGKRVAAGPLAYRARRYVRGRVLLAGDAARFVDPFTGQGVYLALFAAKLACDAVRRMRDGEAMEPCLRRYERALRAQIRRRSGYAWIVGTAVRFPQLAPVARLFAPLVRAVSA